MGLIWSAGPDTVHSASSFQTALPLFRPPEPATFAIELVIRRLRRHGHAYRDTLLIYPDAGHSVVFPYLPVAPGLSLGGTSAGMARADRDSWPIVLRFLSAALGAN
jgi:hypothetical protein